jgi:glutamate dehydrogenase
VGTVSRSGPEREVEQPIVSGLLDRIARLAPADKAAPLAGFARTYVQRMPADLAAQLPEDHLYEQITDLFAFVDARGNEPMAVRVFNPDPAVHGYRTGGAVVEVVVDDSPFLVDSVSATIEEHGCATERVLHPVMGTVRDGDGHLVDIVNVRGAHSRESVQHYELDRKLGDRDALALEAAIRRVLRDVHLAVRDFGSLIESVDRMIAVAREGAARYEAEDVIEAVSFLEWLRDENFIFLGYREYAIEETPEGPAVAVLPGSGLGILSDEERSGYASPKLLSDMEPGLRERYLGGDLLVISKTNRLSTVHRRSRMDYIGLHRAGPDGTIIGEARLLGLFTSKAYMARATTIPLLQRKLDRILEAEDLFEGSHDHKLVIQLFESFPKDELFATPTEEIRRSIMTLVEQEERQQVRLVVRRDLLQRSVSILVALPRDRFNAELRKRLQDLFLERFNGSSVDYRLSLAETGAARIHFTVWVPAGEIPTLPFRQLEREVIDLARNWQDRLADLLAARLDDDERGRDLAQRWAPRFPDYYKSSTGLELVAGDVLLLDSMERKDVPMAVGIQNEDTGADPLTRIAVYHRRGKLPLSAVLPALEALGLQVVEEIPTHLLGETADTFIHDFGVLGADGRRLDLDDCGARVLATVTAALHGEESDSLDRLVISSNLEHTSLVILRAYRTYWRLVNPAFTARYMNDALAAHPDIAESLVRLFRARFDPDGGGTPAETIRQDVLERLDAVQSLDEDRILRGFLGLIMATVRTNAYRPDRSSLSLKLRSAEVPDMPRPLPLYEIFVYAPDVEGIHLRGGMVARGGIRWSDRREDYRTEVLGLMKAQMTKNAVIVPTGSKGGFVPRRLSADPDEVRREVAAAYTTFIRGLLDVTDNRSGGVVAHPDRVVVHDGPDPYLVVAADKGTAKLSDTANAIAAEYGFWLGDAFASGGSAGYDHKALAITARGAWESVKRHFHELGTDIMAEPFTVIGVGDMSGDVFGNGMQLSPEIRLVAAFDHRHIFIDPDPDPATSFAERARLFGLPRSSWDDYDRAAISEGGGVWSRGSKRIDLSPEARTALGTDATHLTPNELIKTILLAPVDLLWSGGIGTYVKAHDETNEQVGDRANDPVRVDARRLRCKVVGEGGNLGFTQPGRIEFARAGGKINTDFIDNSGGVHCSDREVNLKILLGLAEESGEIDRRDRDDLVASVATDVTDRVVYDNFLQAQILTQEGALSHARLEAYEDLMEALEGEELLDRSIERLPSTEEMTERVRNGIDMARPELAVLLAYAKRSLTDSLLASDLPDWEYFETDLERYFPEAVRKRFGHLVADHPLHREIIATILANEVVNAAGITLVSRLTGETGASAADVVRAYRIAREVTGAEDQWSAVEDLVGQIEPEIQEMLMARIDRLVESTTRWYLSHRGASPRLEGIGEVRRAFATLTGSIAEAGPAQWQAECEAEIAALVDQGVPRPLARDHVYRASLVNAPDIVDVSNRTDREVDAVARVFFLVGETFQIGWLEDQVRRLSPSSRWHRLAVQALGDELLVLRRELAERIIIEGEGLPPDVAVGSFVAGRGPAEARLKRFMQRLVRDGADDVESLLVAARQIRSLVA